MKIVNFFPWLLPELNCTRLCVSCTEKGIAVYKILSIVWRGTKHDLPVLLLAKVSTHKYFAICPFRYFFLSWGLIYCEV